MENIQEKIENKIIDIIASGSSGRLVIFKPEKSDKDLVVEKKGGYKNKVISLSVYGKELSEKKDLKNDIGEFVRTKKIKAENNYYILFVYFDIVTQDIEETFLMIPSSKFLGLLDKNNFSEFLTNEKNFVRFLIEVFDKK